MATLDKDIPIQRERGREGYASFLPLLVIAATCGVVLQSALQGIFSRWLKFDEAYSHGLLVLIISLYLVFRNLKAIWPLRLSPNILGFLALTSAAFVWALAQAMSIQVIEEILVPFLLWSSFFSIYGWKQARLLIVPLGFLYFAIPFWDYLSMALQLITVAVNEVGFGLTGISAEIDGIFVHLPGIGTFEVADGCSGLRYLIVGLTLTTLFGYLNYDRWSLRFVLIGIGLLLSLAANWIRVFIIIYVGYKTNMESSLIEDHDMFGWWVFAATLVPLFWVANSLARKGSEPRIERPRVKQEKASLLKQMSVMVTVVAALVIPVGLIKAKNQDSLEYYAPIELPQQMGEWQSLRVSVSPTWSPLMRGYTQKAEIQYFNEDNQRLAVSVYLYSTQAPGRELIQDANRLYDYRNWRVVAADYHQVAGGIAYNQFALEERSNSQRVSVAQGYHVSGISYSNRLKAKLLQVLGFLNGRHDAAEFFVSTTCESDCAVEKDKLHNFITQYGERIKEATERAYFLSVSSDRALD